MLDHEANVSDYKISVEHMESLHAHNATVITTKGIERGLAV